MSSWNDDQLAAGLARLAGPMDPGARDSTLDSILRRLDGLPSAASHHPLPLRAAALASAAAVVLAALQQSPADAAMNEALLNHTRAWLDQAANWTRR